MLLSWLPKSIVRSTTLAFWSCFILVAVFFLDRLLNLHLNGLGILPRDLPTIWHVPLAPFLHGNLNHLIGNVIGLWLFSFAVAAKSKKYFYQSSIFIILFSGLFVWIIGRPALHIGASGWIFGLWALIIVRAFYEKSAKNIFLAMLAIFFHGGMVFGLLPVANGVSFEAHIGGALAGAIFAKLKHK